MSFDTARTQTGFGGAFLKRLIGHVEGFSKAEITALTETTPDQLDRALKFWSGLCNLTAAAAALQVRPVQVKTLIDCGLLRSIHVPCKAGSIRTQQDLLGDLTPTETARYGRSFHTPSALSGR